MPIGRLFFEISGDTSRLNASIKESIKIAEEAGVKITRAGQGSHFNAACDVLRVPSNSEERVRGHRVEEAQTEPV